jgi:hypothetical protein
MRDRFYSTADLSRLCGVSISTIKRWTDAGLLRCVRTPGGHRKYRVQDVAEAARRLGLCSADAGERAGARVDELALLLLQGNHEALCGRVAAALAGGDVPAARGLVLDLHRHGMRLVEAALMLRTALRPIDANLSASDHDAFVRRRAVQVAVATCRHLLEQAPPAPPEAPLALVTSIPSARDELATPLALIALAECGWRCVDLGPASRPDVVRGGLRAVRTDCVVLVDDGTDTGLAAALRAEAVAAGVEWLAVDAADDAALTGLGTHAAARERRLMAAMV